LAAGSNVKATDPMDDMNHRGDLEHQFRNEDHLKDERFAAVLTHKKGAEEMHDVCPISSATIPIPHKMSEMKTS
jgi:hypothetical protein